MPTTYDEMDEPTLFDRMRGGFRHLLVFIGLSRPVNEDGTRGKRHTRRLLGIIGAIVGLWLLSTMFAVVPAGSAGVPVTLGHAGGGLGQGFHITWPLTTVRNISTRTTAYTMSATGAPGDQGSQDDSVSVLGADGGSGTVDSTVLLRIEPDQATNVYVHIGADYLTTVVRPSARACIRAVFTDVRMVEAATTGWQGIEDAVTDCMKDKLDGRGITLEDFQLREVRLEKSLQQAIIEKTSAEQRVARQRFEQTIAEIEAQITRVNAKATADSQQILACGGTASKEVDEQGEERTVVVPNLIDDCSQAQLTPAYLQWSYIQALQSLVDSPNNSTVILPFDQNLTPLLDLGGSNPVTPPESAPAEAGG
jgi:regulator of protease activity HflC (stomatin/prohibitin superfamily)